MPLPEGLNITEEQIQAARATGAEWAKSEPSSFPAKASDAMDRVDPAVTDERERTALAWEVVEGYRLLRTGQWPPPAREDSPGVTGFAYLGFEDKPREGSVYMDNANADQLISHVPKKE